MKTSGSAALSDERPDTYDRIRGPDGYIDNIMLCHSLRPQTLEGHMMLYKNLLHHRSNQLPKWLLETIGVYVSLLNECSYCVDHHAQGLRRLTTPSFGWR